MAKFRMVKICPTCGFPISKSHGTNYCPIDGSKLNSRRIEFEKYYEISKEWTRKHPKFERRFLQYNEFTGNPALIAH
jgi:uncharacterized Zn finger protein (UPF0148 family)